MIQTTPQPSISIVICTYNRADMLRYCLRSLALQEAEKNLFEVLVVDNGSTDATQRIAALYAARNQNFRVLCEPNIGLGHARNLGWREAHSNWIAYLDDDAMAEVDYVERALWIISNHDFECFGGRAHPWYKYGRPKWYRDSFVDNEKDEPSLHLLKDDQFVSGMNCVFQRDILKALGGFPVDIGMKGHGISYGEEVLLQKRLRKSGGRVGFDPHLVVKHVVLPHKLKVSWLLRASFAHGRDSWAIFEIEPSLRRIVGATVKLIIPLLKLPLFLNRFYRSNYYMQNFCVELGSPVAHELGRLSGALFRQWRSGE
jgi:glycosyltransferase involved in cell wall biosynthesis